MLHSCDWSPELCLEVARSHLEMLNGFLMTAQAWRAARLISTKTMVTPRKSPERSSGVLERYQVAIWSSLGRPGLVAGFDSHKTKEIFF